jgi:hypothetical protein
MRRKVYAQKRSGAGVLGLVLVVHGDVDGSLGSRLLGLLVLGGRVDDCRAGRDRSGSVYKRRKGRHKNERKSGLTTREESNEDRGDRGEVDRVAEEDHARGGDGELCSTLTGSGSEKAEAESGWKPVAGTDC